MYELKEKGMRIELQFGYKVFNPSVTDDSVMYVVATRQFGIDGIFGMCSAIGMGEFMSKLSNAVTELERKRVETSITCLTLTSNDWTQLTRGMDKLTDAVVPYAPDAWNRNVLINIFKWFKSSADQVCTKDYPVVIATITKD